MKIKMLRTPGKPLAKALDLPDGLTEGESREVSDDKAEKLIQRGLAEPAGEKKKRTVQTQATTSGDIKGVTPSGASNDDKK